MGGGEAANQGVAACGASGVLAFRGVSSSGFRVGCEGDYLRSFDIEHSMAAGISIAAGSSDSPVTSDEAVDTTVVEAEVLLATTNTSSRSRTFSYSSSQVFRVGVNFACMEDGECEPSFLIGSRSTPLGQFEWPTRIVTFILAPFFGNTVIISGEGNEGEGVDTNRLNIEVGVSLALRFPRLQMHWARDPSLDNGYIVASAIRQLGGIAQSLTTYFALYQHAGTLEDADLMSGGNTDDLSNPLQAISIFSSMMALASDHEYASEFEDNRRAVSIAIEGLRGILLSIFDSIRPDGLASLMVSAGMVLSWLVPNRPRTTTLIRIAASYAFFLLGALLENRDITIAGAISGGAAADSPDIDEAADLYEYGFEGCLTGENCNTSGSIMLGHAFDNLFTGIRLSLPQLGGGDSATGEAATEALVGYTNTWGENVTRFVLRTYASIGLTYGPTNGSNLGAGLQLGVVFVPRRGHSYGITLMGSARAYLDIPDLDFTTILGATIGVVVF